VIYARQPEITPMLSIPVSIAIGGMNRSVNAEFGCNELLLPRITPSIPELARPAYII
jgi:hypothetical protein